MADENDLFEAHGIIPKAPGIDENDLFATHGITPPVSQRQVIQAKSVGPLSAPVQLPERSWPVEFASRLVSGVADAGQNILQNAGKIYGIDVGPREDFSKILANISEERPKEGFIPSAIEGVAQGIPAMLGPSKFFSGVSSVPILARAAAPALLGGGVGAATSENPLIGGILGATQGAIPLVNSLRPSVVGKNIDNAYAAMGTDIADAYGAAKGKYKALYDSILKEADTALPTKFVVPKSLQDLGPDANYLLEKLPKNKILKFQQFLENPTIENAHWAQSSLEKLTRGIEKKLVPSDLEQELLPIAKNLREKMQQAIGTNFAKINKPEIAQQYKQTGLGYLEDVVPFDQTVMRDYLKGNVSEKTLGKKMMRNEAFTLKKPAQGIKQRDTEQAPILRKLLGAGLLGVGGSAGGYGTYLGLKSTLGHK